MKHEPLPITSFSHLVALDRFSISDSFQFYTIRSRDEKYYLFVHEEEGWQQVGEVNKTPWSFVVKKRVQGIFLSKEVAFTEIILKMK